MIFSFPALIACLVLLAIFLFSQVSKGRTRDSLAFRLVILMLGTLALQRCLMDTLR